MKSDSTTAPFYKTIGLARENESPENPGALEKRVALIPADVKKLVEAGCEVFVEEGAGSGVGFTDEEYRAAGAGIQPTEALYADKDLIIKFKGPAMEHIPLMRRGCTLFCMAHFHSFPERAKLLEAHQITVVAMENIVEAPARQNDDDILGRMAANACMEPAIRFGIQQKRSVAVLGYSERLKGMIRRFANLSPAWL
ncbi:MAG: alanine dehydrogenase, partial [Cyclonatronaceae bacterium]